MIHKFGIKSRHLCVDTTLTSDNAEDLSQYRIFSKGGLVGGSTNCCTGVLYFLHQTFPGYLAFSVCIVATQ